MNVMRRTTRFASPLAVFMMLSPLPAIAQGVVADELWQAWTAAVAEAGGALSAREEREGNKLILRDLRLTTGEDGGELGVETVTLTNQADGSVAVVLPDTFPLIIDFPDRPRAAKPQEGYRPEQMVLSVAAPDLSLIVRGIGDRAEFEAAAPDIALRLERFLPAMPAEEGELHIEAGLEAFALRYARDFAASVPVVDGAFSFGAGDAAVALNGAAEGDLLASLRFGATEAGFSGAFPQSLTSFDTKAAGIGDFLQLLDDGMRLGGNVALGALEMRLDLMPGEGEAAPAQPPRVEFDMGSAVSSFSLETGGLASEIALNGLRLKVEGDELDFGPAGQGEVTLGEYRNSLKIGLNDMVRPQDWALAFVLRELALSPDLWLLADPKSEIPHEDMTLAIDLAGKYALTPEAMQPETFSSDQMPLRAFSLGIRELTMALLGVGLTGSGDLDFDMQDLTTWNGFPAPLGSLSFAATGVNGLIERMGASGQMTAEQIGGIRMALLMIARAGEAPGSLVSALEFRKEGFFLNGMKIR